MFEDIHWADAGLLDFIDHLADWAQGPILTVALARPELLDIRPGWSGGKRNAATLYLDPLTGDEAEKMVAELLPHADSRELRETIAERSEGNPALRRGDCAQTHRRRRPARVRRSLAGRCQTPSARLSFLDPYKRWLRRGSTCFPMRRSVFFKTPQWSGGSSGRGQSLP